MSSSLSHRKECPTVLWAKCGTKKQHTHLVCVGLVGWLEAGAERAARAKNPRSAPFTFIWLRGTAGGGSKGKCDDVLAHTSLSCVLFRNPARGQHLRSPLGVCARAYLTTIRGRERNLPLGFGRGNGKIIKPTLNFDVFCSFRHESCNLEWNKLLANRLFVWIPTIGPIFQEIKENWGFQPFLMT